MEIYTLDRCKTALWRGIRFGIDLAPPSEMVAAPTWQFKVEIRRQRETAARMPGGRFCWRGSPWALVDQSFQKRSSIKPLQGEEEAKPFVVSQNDPLLDSDIYLVTVRTVPKRHSMNSGRLPMVQRSRPALEVQNQGASRMMQMPCK